MPARALSAAARYCFTHPVSPLHRREGLDPSAAARGWPPYNLPFTPRSRACPARNLPAACRQSSTAHPFPKTTLPRNPLATHHPHNLCPPTAITPIYTLPKLLPQTLSKKSKKLAKTC